MIGIFHMKVSVYKDQTEQEVVAAWNAGDYYKVADIKVDELDEAYMMAYNRKEKYWTDHPIVIPLFKHARSITKGDILEQDGKLYVVDQSDSFWLALTVPYVLTPKKARKLQHQDIVCIPDSTTGQVIECHAIRAGGDGFILSTTVSNKEAVAHYEKYNRDMLRKFRAGGGIDTLNPNFPIYPHLIQVLWARGKFTLQRRELQQVLETGEFEFAPMNKPKENV